MSRIESALAAAGTEPRPLEFVRAGESVSCTAEAVNLAFVGLASLCVGYYVARAIGPHYDESADDLSLRDEQAGSVDDLIGRRGELARR